MKIVDKNDNIITSPDLERGYLVSDRLFVRTHDAVPGTEGKGHYDIVAEYPNGGKDVKWVWDVEPVKDVPAWDEYEDVQRYIEYTPEELEEIERQKAAPTMESLAAENKKLASQLQAAIDANANLEECLVEMAEIVYA